MSKTLSTVAARLIIIIDLFNLDFEDQSRMWTNAYALHIKHLLTKNSPILFKGQGHTAY